MTKRDGVRKASADAFIPMKSAALYSVPQDYSIIVLYVIVTEQEDPRDYQGRRTEPSVHAAATDFLTVSLVSRVPAGRDFLNFFLTKESRYGNSRHTIVTALPPSVRWCTCDLQ